MFHLNVKVLYGLTSTSWCCGWCEFSTRSMTTKKGLRKRRRTILSCGMLEVQWVVPLVSKAREQCFITHWMVSLLGVNVFSVSFSVKSSLLVPEQESSKSGWGLSCSFWFIQYLYIYTRKKLMSFLEFMDSVLNCKAILGKPVQMSFVNLSLQSCAAGVTGSLWSWASFPVMLADIKGCLRLSRSDRHAEISPIFSCLFSSKTYSWETLFEFMAWYELEFMIGTLIAVSWQIWTVLP